MDVKVKAIIVDNSKGALYQIPNIIKLRKNYDNEAT